MVCSTGVGISVIEMVILAAVLVHKFGPTLSGLTYDRIDAALIDVERRRGNKLWIVQLSFMLTIAACLYARVDTGCAYLGGHYARLAADPFAFDPDNPVSYRILTPLISYCLGLHRGCMINLTNLIFVGVMTGWVYAYFRKITPRPTDALITTITLTFSLVALTTIYRGGYTDIQSYLLIFLMWRFRNRRVVFHTLFLLGLLNRESIAFLIPWFAFISLEGDNKPLGRVLDLTFGFAVTLGLYYLFRVWVQSHQEVPYSLDYYLKPVLEDPLYHLRQTYYYQGLGLFSVFKLAWVFPLMALASWFKEKNYREIAGAALLIICAWTQLFVAYDTSRMFTLGFMVMILSLKHLFETNRFQVRRLAIWIVLFNLLIPQVSTDGTRIEVFQSASAFLIGLLW